MSDFNSIPEEKRREIERKATELYISEMQAEAAKTEAQREAETLQSEVGQLSAKIDEMNARPDLYALEIPKLMSQLDQKLGRLQQLGAAEGEQGPQLTHAGGRNIYMVDGRILTDGPGE